MHAESHEGSHCSEHMGKLLEGTGRAFVGDQSGPTQFFHDTITAVFRTFLADLIFLMMFIIGTGNTRALGKPRYLNRGTPS